jgi:hypothetical protein
MNLVSAYLQVEGCARIPHKAPSMLGPIKVKLYFFVLERYYWLDNHETHN